MSAPWLVLVVSLPTNSTAGRMRVWRAMKALGCGVLRDGVYLLPQRDDLRRAVRAQADDVIAGGGSAHLLVLESDGAAQQRAFESLFDRAERYGALVAEIRRAGAVKLEGLPKVLRRLRREFDAIAAIDHFPGAARDQAAALLDEFEQASNDRLSPDEPRAAARRRIRPLRREDYRGRLWATRQRPFIDRLASAWLIRRCIDPDARFRWLASPKDCPKRALGFDFDGATFTHVAGKVTFEVLLESFGLTDPALVRIGTLVHYLDVGGIPVAEASGLEAVLRGLARQRSDDDELLDAALDVFDALHQSFGEPAE